MADFGDAALLVSFGDRIDARLNARVHGLAARVRHAREHGDPWWAPVPAYASLLLPYDPGELDARKARERLAVLLETPLSDEDVPSMALPPVEIPVRYGGMDGPDLDEVADRLGLTVGSVVELHAEATYRVFMLGFAPGFAYLGPLPEPLRLPRRATPRIAVPAGSVAIAAEQTAVYPLETPGGWHLVGRTELSLWDARRDPPALLRPGQEVRFRPLTA